MFVVIEIDPNPAGKRVLETRPLTLLWRHWTMWNVVTLNWKLSAFAYFFFYWKICRKRNRTNSCQLHRSIEKRSNVSHLYRFGKPWHSIDDFSSSSFFSHSSSILLFNVIVSHLLHISIVSLPSSFLFFPSSHSIKDHKLRKLVQFVPMSQAIKNNRGFLQLLAVCPAHQRQFLLRTASPQQLHALVQVLYNVLKEYILIPEEKMRKVLSYKDVLTSKPSRKKCPLQNNEANLCSRGCWFYSRPIGPCCYKVRVSGVFDAIKEETKL